MTRPSGNKIPQGADERGTERVPLPVWKKLLFALVTMTAVLPIVELVFFCVGPTPTCLDEDPFVGFSSQIPHFSQKAVSTAPPIVAVASGTRASLNEQQFPAQKPAGTFRIICLGGSTTYGRPFFDSTSFAGWLRALLPVADPSRDWEVINAGAISYASYRVTGVLQELCAYEPDLFVVYTGHNEFLERRTYAAILDTPWLLREAAGLARRTRTGTAMRWALERLGLVDGPLADKPITLTDKVKAIPVNAVGPEAYTRDDRFKQQVVEHFRINLERMVDRARTAGAKIVFVTPASNLADFAPFKSEHRGGLSAAERRDWEEHYRNGRRRLATGDTAAAVSTFKQALAIDNRHAGLHFSLAQALLRANLPEEARRHFERAREEDICPLRAITAIVETVRQVAVERRVSLVDCDRIVTAESEDHIPGDSFFHDHVHPTIDANRSLALEIIATLTDAGIVQPGPKWNREAIDAVTAEVMEGIDRPTHAAELHKLARMLQWLGHHEQARHKALEALELSAGSADSLYQVGLLYHQQEDPETAARYYRRALEQKDDFPEAQMQLGVTLASLGETDVAIDHLTKATDLKPDLAPAHSQLGLLLTKKGRLERARHHFAKVADLQPESDTAHNNLGLALAHLGRPDEAIEHYRRAIRLNPKNSSAHLNYGIALEQQGKRTEAIERYGEVLRLRPDHKDARTRLEALERGTDVP